MSRLPEMLLVEVLRLHLASAPAVGQGWLAALNDPILRPAMSLLHGAPGRHWTVSALAREAAVSRSVLDARFRDVLGRSPRSTAGARQVADAASAGSMLPDRSIAHSAR